MPNNYVLLETIALTQSAASVTFDNLPTSGYTDLKIVMSARRSAGNFPNPLIQFNNDTASNYRWRGLYGDGASAASNNSTSATSILFGVMTGSSETANTFGSGEAYIPNYLSNSQKSVSIEALGETNASTAYMYMVAGLWTGTAAITSIKVLPGNADPFAAGSTFSLYGIAALGTTPVLAPKATGGNIVANDGTYWYHAFTSSGYFVPQVGLTADVLRIAGGGAGGGNGGSAAGNGMGGGGAGGLLYSSSQSLSSSCTVVIGAGGSGASDPTSGVATTFSGLTATVGGGKGTTINSTVTAWVPPEIGGSGGGGGAGSNNGADGTLGQGNAGGSSSTAGSGAGGGGGGAASAGTAGTGSSGAGSGGAGGSGSSAYSAFGLATMTGENVSGTVYYAGGGGGSSGTAPSAGAGGNGGGGDGSLSTGAAQDGLANTGGGGGGRRSTGPTGGTNGGSGIVIVRYPIN